MLVNLIIMLVVIGALLYIMQMLPIDAIIKNIIYVVVIVAIVIYVLRHLAVLGL